MGEIWVLSDPSPLKSLKKEPKTSKARSTYFLQYLQPLRRVIKEKTKTVTFLTELHHRLLVL